MGSSSQRPRDPEPRDEHLRYQMRVLRHMLREYEFDAQRSHATRLAYQPLISVITPVFNTPPDVLRQTLSSVKTQTYPHWEHCLFDDGSDQLWLSRKLARLAQSDPRVKFNRCATNGGIVVGSNAALALASGEFIALLDHDDELDAEALYRVALLLNEHPDADMIYSDFDVRAANGMRGMPFFKPDWSPEYQHALPYTTHLTVYRTKLVRSIGGYREGLDGSQDFDLALRAMEVTNKIFHIPRVLYHWRMLPGSSAADIEAKPYAFGAAKQAVSDYISRNGIDAMREDTAYPYGHRIRRNVRARPLVSMVALAWPLPGLMTSAAHGQLERSLSNLVDENAYPQLELVVVAPSSLVDQAPAVFETLRSAGRELVFVDDPDVGHTLNAGAAAARGEHLVFLGEELGAIERDWVTALLEYSEQDPIGAVGPKVYASDGTVQHAGVVVVDGEPRRVHAGANRRSWGYFCNLVLPMNYSAVSGACLMTRRAVFHEVGGFEAAANVGFSDIDYCLRVRGKGYRIVFTPFAELRQLGAVQSTIDDTDRVRLFRARWDSPSWRDPYYNPNLKSTEPLFTVALD